MFLVVSASLAMLMVVWFKTDAFVEYMKLIGLTKRFYIEEYLAMQAFEDSSYIEHVNYHHDSFISRLLICPICVSMWLSILLFPVFGAILILPTAFLSLSLYLLAAKLLDNDKRGSK